MYGTSVNVRHGINFYGDFYGKMNLEDVDNILEKNVRRPNKLLWDDLSLIK